MMATIAAMKPQKKPPSRAQGKKAVWSATGSTLRQGVGLGEMGIFTCTAISQHEPREEENGLPRHADQRTESDHAEGGEVASELLAFAQDRHVSFVPRCSSPLFCDGR
jgi:hypothetical protein